MTSRTILALVVAVVVSACTGGRAAQEVPATTAVPPTTAPPATTSPPATTAPASTTTTTVPAAIMGVVSDVAGRPLSGATVHAAGTTVTTGPEGTYSLRAPLPAEVTVSKPAWLAQSVVATAGGTIDVELEPRMVHALRVSRYVAMEPELWQGHLDMAATSSINAFVFDTKDETGTVLYETEVAKAHELDAVRPVYDPAALLADAKAAGLYTITRIVTFEDEVWTRGEPEAKLGGIWVDATNRANWEYPLGLAVEACRLGFEEIQFDYVRFPAGITGDRYLATSSSTQEERVDTMASFLAEARDRLHPLGCAVAAAIFGIVMSSNTDEGIGQDPGVFSNVVDVVSPMIYPSHYSPGWLGFGDPNAHPGPVVADALDQGLAKMSGGAIARPWLQAFYYSPGQIGAQLAEAGTRQVGWMLWNAGGNYNPAALPPAEALEPE